MKHKNKAIARFALAISLAPGCAAILGVSDDPGDAIKTFCGCDEVRAILADEPDCVGRLGAKLAAASEEDRAAWLAAYADHCSHCPSASDCYYLLPMCARLHEPCNRSEECCAFRGGTVHCVDNNGTKTCE